MFKSFVGLTLALPLLAFATEASKAGVWQGTLGKNSVVLCINTDQESGSYYYATHRTPIQLQRVGQRWNEEGDTGKWELTASSSAGLAGTWNPPKGGTPLPIQLALVSSESDRNACASDAFNAVLETMPLLQTGAEKKFNGYAYRSLRVADVETVELLSPSAAQDAINRQLKAMLPKSISALTEYFVTRRDRLGRSGFWGEDEVNAEPVFWNREFVTIEFHRWVAGTGRLGITQQFLTWDLKSGSSVDLWDWFAITPMREKGRKVHRLFRTVAPELRCKEGYNGEGQWRVMLEANAVRFMEEAYGDGCEKEIVIPYRRLFPVLSPRGKLAVARLLGKHSR